MAKQQKSPNLITPKNTQEGYLESSAKKLAKERIEAGEYFDPEYIKEHGIGAPADYQGIDTYYGQLEKGAFDKYSDYIGEDLLKGGQYTFEELNKLRAENQSNWEQAGHAVGRVVTNIIPQTLSGFASMLDIKGYWDAEHAANNGIVNWAMDAKKTVDEDWFPIYEENPGQSMQLGDFAWWMSRGSGLVESVGSFLLQGAGMGKLVSTGLKGIGTLTRGKQLLKAVGIGAEGSKKLYEGSAGLLNAVALNQSEAVLEATQVFRDTYEDQLAKNGGDFAKAKQAASIAAATTMQINRANILLNLSSASAFITPLKYTRKLLDAPSTAKTLGKLAFEGGQEAAEELVNHVGSKAGMAKGKGEKYTLEDAFNDMGSMEGFEAAFLGAIGGVGQKGGTNLFNKTKFSGERDENGNRISVYETEKNRYEQQQKVIQELKEKGVNTTDVLKSYKDQLVFQDKLQKAHEKAKTTGDYSEVETLKNEMFENQAIKAFQSGTTEILEDLYKAEAARPVDEVGQEYIDNANNAIKQLKQLESIYNNFEGYSNVDEIFFNRANKNRIERSAKDIEAAKKSADLELHQQVSEIAKKYEYTNEQPILFKKNGELERTEMRTTTSPLTYSLADLQNNTGTTESNQKVYEQFLSEVEKLPAFQKADQYNQQASALNKTLIENEKEFQTITSQEYQEKAVARKAEAVKLEQLKKDLEKATTKSQVENLKNSTKDPAFRKAADDKLADIELKNVKEAKVKQIKATIDGLNTKINAATLDNIEDVRKEVDDAELSQKDKQSLYDNLNKQARRLNGESVPEEESGLSAFGFTATNPEEDASGTIDNKKTEEELKAEQANFETNIPSDYVNPSTEKKSVEEGVAEAAGSLLDSDRTMVVGEDEEGNLVYNYSRSQEGHNRAAFLSREMNQTEEIGSVNREEITNDIDNIKLLDPDFMTPGTELVMEIDTKYSGDKYDPSSNTRETIAWNLRLEQLQKMADEKGVPLNELDEYIDEVPIKVTTKDGKTVFYVHDNAWYREENLDNTIEAIGLDKAKNHEIRKEIIKSGKVKSKVTYKSMGRLFKTYDNKSIPVSEAMPDGNLILAIGRSDSFEVDLNGATLLPSTPQNGRLYAIVPVGKDTYLPIPLERQPLTEEAIDSIVFAIEGYLSQDRDNPVAKAIRESSLGLDITELSQLGKYINQFVGLFYTKGTQGLEPFLINGGKNSSLKSAHPLIAVTATGIEFGKPGIENGSYIHNGKKVVRYTATISANFKDKTANYRNKETLEKKLRPMLKAMMSNADRKTLAMDGDAVIILNSEGETSTKKYTEFVKETHKTNILSVNTGTEENPKWAYTIQPTILFDTSFADLSKIKPVAVKKAVPKAAPKVTPVTSTTTVSSNKKLNEKQAEVENIRAELNVKYEELKAKGLPNTAEIWDNPEYVAIKNRLNAAEAELDALESPVSNKKADIESYFSENTKSTKDSKYNPDLSGEGSLALMEQENRLLELGADRIQAHGMAKGSVGEQFKDLLNILTNGLDPNRGGGILYSAPLVLSTDMKRAGSALGTAGGAAYIDGAFIILGKKGVNTIKSIDDIGGVLVNQAVVDTLPELVSKLKSLFPNLSIDSYSNSPNVIAELAALEGTTTTNETEIKNKKAEIEKLEKEKEQLLSTQQEGQPYTPKAVTGYTGVFWETTSGKETNKSFYRLEKDSENSNNGLLYFDPELSMSFTGAINSRTSVIQKYFDEANEFDFNTVKGIKTIKPAVVQKSPNGTIQIIKRGIVEYVSTPMKDSSLSRPSTGTTTKVDTTEVDAKINKAKEELAALEAPISDKKAEIEAKYNKIIEEEGLNILAPITLDERGLSSQEIQEARKKQAEQLERDKRLAELNKQKQKDLAALEQQPVSTNIEAKKVEIQKDKELSLASIKIDRSSADPSSYIWNYSIISRLSDGKVITSIVEKTEDEILQETGQATAEEGIKKLIEEHYKKELAALQTASAATPAVSKTSVDLKKYKNSEIADAVRKPTQAENILGKLLSKEEQKVSGGTAVQEVYENGIIQRIFAEDGSKIQRLIDYDGNVIGIPLINLTMDALEAGLLFNGKKDFSLTEKEISDFFNSKFDKTTKISTTPVAPEEDVEILTGDALIERQAEEILKSIGDSKEALGQLEEYLEGLKNVKDAVDSNEVSIDQVLPDLQKNGFESLEDAIASLQKAVELFNSRAENKDSFVLPDGTTIELDDNTPDASDIDDDTVDEMISPMDSSQIESIRTEVEDMIIRGLDPSTQASLISYIASDIISRAMAAKDKGQEGVKTAPIFAEHKKSFEALEKLYKERNLVNKAARMRAVLDQFDKVNKLVNQKIRLLTTGTVQEDINLDDNEEAMGLEKVVYTDDWAFTVNSKSTASADLKKFFVGIRAVDENGKPVSNILGLPEIMTFDTVYNTLHELLANRPADYNHMIETLELYKEKFPWIQAVVDKLEKAPKKIQNEFVSDMAKHHIDMKFLMWSKDRNGNYSLQRWSSNSSSIEQRLRAVWQSNLKGVGTQSNLVILNEDNEYVYNQDLVDNLIEQAQVFKQDPTKVTNDDLANWLGQFGIVISDDTYRDLRKGEFKNRGKKSWAQLFTNDAGLVFALAKELKAQRFMLLDDAKILNDSVVKALAKLDALNNMNTFSNSFQAGGKTVYSYGNNNYLVNRMRDLTAYDHSTKKFVNQKLIDDLKQISFTKDSLWLADLTNEGITGDLTRNTLDIGYLSLEALKKLFTESRDNRKLNNLSTAEHELTKIGFFQRVSGEIIKDPKTGIPEQRRSVDFFYPTMSDKTTMLLISGLTRQLKLNAEGNISDENIKLLYKALVTPEINRIRAKQSTNIKGYEPNYFYFLPSLNTLEIEVNGETKTFLDIVKDGNDTLFDDQVEQAVLNEIRFVFDNLITKKLEDWKKLGIGQEIRDDKGKVIEKYSFMDKAYMSEVAKEGKGTNRVKYAAMDYVFNYLIANSEAFKLFAGDPALYAKFNKDNTLQENLEETFVNIGKRLAGDIAPGIELADSTNNKYYQVFFQDKKIDSNNVKDSVQREFFEKVISTYADTKKGYGAIEGSDAQEYTTWQEHLYVMKQLGRITDAQYNTFKTKLEAQSRGIFKASTILTYDEMGIVMQPIKPVYVGNIISSEDNADRRVYIKSSSFPLLPQLTQGLQIDKIRQSLEKFEETEGKKITSDGTPAFVRASFGTANKVGAVSKAVEVFDNQGNVLDNIEVKLENSLLLSRENFRIQQDVPYKRDKADINIGTQERTLLFADLLDVKIDGEITGAELMELYNKQYEELFAYASEKLSKKLGLIQTVTTESSIESLLTIPDSEIFDKVEEFSEKLKAASPIQKVKLQQDFADEVGEDTLERVNFINKNFDKIVEQLAKAKMNFFFDEETDTNKKCD